MYSMLVTLCFYWIVLRRQIYKDLVVPLLRKQKVTDTYGTYLPFDPTILRSCFYQLVFFTFLYRPLYTDQERSVQKVSCCAHNGYHQVLAFFTFVMAADFSSHSYLSSALLSPNILYVQYTVLSCKTLTFQHWNIIVKTQSICLQNKQEKYFNEFVSSNKINPSILLF